MFPFDMFCFLAPKSQFKLLLLHVFDAIWKEKHRWTNSLDIHDLFDAVVTAAERHLQ